MKKVHETTVPDWSNSVNVSDSNEQMQRIQKHFKIDDNQINQAFFTSFV